MFQENLIITDFIPIPIFKMDASPSSSSESSSSSSKAALLHASLTASVSSLSLSSPALPTGPTRRIGIRSSIYEKNILKSRGEVSLSAFALLFSELVQYSQNRVSSVSDLERKLEEAGYGIGQRMSELVGCRERATKRETRIVNMLQYVCNVFWKHLFNKAADNLERSTENEDEYMIHEHAPVTNAFVSVPADMGQLNCASFLAGVSVS